MTNPHECTCEATCCCAPANPEPVADRWADLERLAKAARDLCAEANTVSGISWFTEHELSTYEPEDAAFIAAANPAAILELIAAARQQPNREG